MNVPDEGYSHLLTMNVPGEEEFQDTTGVIRIRKSKKNRQHNGQWKRTKGKTTIYKTYTSN